MFLRTHASTRNAAARLLVFPQSRSRHKTPNTSFTVSRNTSSFSSSSRRLHNRVAIISGASGGLGRCIALNYANEGAHVVCADLQPLIRGAAQDSEDMATHELIQERGGKSIFVQTDVSDARSMQALVDSAVREFGRLDIMVNNAAIAPEAQNPTPIYETALSVFDSTMLVNARGVFLGCKYAGTQMMQQEPHPSGDRGWIINIASVLGLVGKSGTIAYSGAKGAVVNMTRTAALDYAGQRIHVNAIAPGFTQTAMIAALTADPDVNRQVAAAHPFKGLGAPEDIAKAALFLASDDANWVTGVTLPVDGGYTAQ